MLLPTVNYVDKTPQELATRFGMIVNGACSHSNITSIQEKMAARHCADGRRKKK